MGQTEIYIQWRLVRYQGVCKLNGAGQVIIDRGSILC